MKSKTAVILLSSFIIFVFLLSIFLNIYFLFLHHYKGSTSSYEWSKSDTFDITQISTVQKQKDKDFVILNLADVQMCDLEDLWHLNTIHKEITYLVNETKPDLITLTGDQTWSNENLICLNFLIKWLDEYKIPYAPVFGNHDYGNSYDSAVAGINYCCDLYEKGKYCLFKRGPNNLGTLGNYVINIMEDGAIYKTIYMIDSGYAPQISDEQIAWLEWNANGIKQANNGNFSSGMCFMHKPIPEFGTAYFKYLHSSEQVQPIGDIYINWSTYGSSQNGFFDVAKNINISNIVCGHQHGNCATFKYQEVSLTFALKTGELGGFYEDEDVYLNGATYFTLNQDGANVNNIFVSKEQFKI